MLVGTCSGVTSAGMVISSALVGTSSGNSSLTSDRISDVFPTPWSPTSRMRTCRRWDADHATIIERAVFYSYLPVIESPHSHLARLRPDDTADRKSKHEPSWVITTMTPRKKNFVLTQSIVKIASPPPSSQKVEFSQNCSGSSPSWIRNNQLPPRAPTTLLHLASIQWGSTKFENHPAA